MRRNKAELFVLALLAVCCLFAFVTGAGSRRMVWEDLPYTLLDFPSGLSRSLAAGDEYGEMNDGPGLTLPAGTYRVKWRVSSDGDNVLRLSGKYGLNSDTAEIRLPAGQAEGTAEFTLREAAAGLSLVFCFEDGTEFEVRDLRLYGPPCRDGAFLFALLAGLFFLLFCLWRRGRLPQARRMRLCLLALAVLIASAPALKDTVCLGHDTAFHLVRILNLADGLKGGFPVRLGGFSYNGFGAITPVFYPDFFLTLPAGLIALGCSMTFAVNLACVLISALSALAMYRCAGRIFGDEDAALSSAVLYTLSVYRVSDLFTRFAVGEALAMAFLPLFLLGLWEVLLGEKARWPLLGLSAAAICLSHVLSTALSAGLALACCLLCLGRAARERRLSSVAKAFLLALALCAFWLVPFLHFARQGLGAASLMKDPGYAALQPAQLFLLGEGELAVDPADRGLATFSLELGLPMLLGAAITLGLQGRAGEDRRQARTALAIALLGLGCALVSTRLFPWSHLRRLTGGFSDYLQFAWRFLMPSAVLLALAGGWGYARFFSGRGEQTAALLLALCALAALPTLSRETRSNSYIPFGECASPDLAYTEYTLPGTRPQETRGASLLTEGDVRVTDYEKRGSRVTARVSAAENARLILPLYGYDGYEARLDGRPLPVSCGGDRRLAVALEAGAEGTLRVRYVGLPLWHVFDLLSALTLAVCIARGCRARGRERKVTAP